MVISANSPAALNCRLLLKQGIGKAPPHAYPGAACDSDCAWQLARLAAAPKKQSRRVAEAFKRQNTLKLQRQAPVEGAPQAV